MSLKPFQVLKFNNELLHTKDNNKKLNNPTLNVARFIVSKYRWTEHSLVTLLANHIIYYLSPINLTYAVCFGLAAGICLVIQILSGIFLITYYMPYIPLSISVINSNTFSFLTCEAPNWEIGTAELNEKVSNLELWALFILVLALIIVFLYFIRLIYSSKKRRTLLEVVLDKYIYLFMSALNKVLPRRVIYITGGFGSLLVRVLFSYKVINIKWAIVLAFILPFMSFAFFVGFLLLPLYLSGAYPNSFGKFFFRFLERFASKEGFSLLIREHHTDGKYLPVVYKPGKYLPVIQKRGR